MLKKKKINKRGVSIVEIFAAIAIIGMASSTLTAMILSSYKGSMRAEQHVLAEQVAKTYDTCLSQDISKTSLAAVTDTAIPNKEYTVICSKDDGVTTLATLTASDSYSYKALSGTENPLTLNDLKFTKDNVKVEIYILSKSFGYYKLRTTVYYMDGRSVSYEGTHFAK